MTARKWDRNEQMTRGRHYDLEQRQGHQERYHMPRVEDRHFRRREQPYQRNRPRRPQDQLINGLKSILQPNKNCQDKKSDCKGQRKQPNYTKGRQLEGQIYRSQYAEVKQSLDAEIENYWLRKPKDRDEKHRGERQREVKGGSDDSRDDWTSIKNDEDGKQTSQTDKKQGRIIYDDDFLETIPPKPTLTPSNHKRSQPTTEQIKPALKEKKNRQQLAKKEEIINILEDVLNSDSQAPEQQLQIDLRKKEESHQFSSLLAEQSFIVQTLPAQNKLPSRLNEPPAATEAKSQEDILKAVDQLSKQPKRTVYLQFEAEDNVLEFKIKEIDLVELATTIKILANGQIQLKKYPTLSSTDLQHYVEIDNTGHFFPRMSVAKPETVHKAVEGQSQQAIPVGNIAEIKLCRICSSNVTKKQQKINKDLLVARLVSVRCMQCDAKNEIPVLQDDYSVACSCHKCSAKIMGKIIGLRIDDK